MNAHSPRRKTITLGGALKRVVTIEDLNERFALLEQDGSPSVFVSRRDFLPLQDCDLRRRLANEVVEVDMKDGKPIYAAAFKVWTGHADRHVYRRVVFTSKPIGADCLNLFCGFGVTPKAGNCEKIIAHIRDVICSSNERDAEAAMKLLAWQIQNIGKPSRIVTVLKSEKQQAGKGVLLGELMAKIYGSAGFTAAATDQILGRFNTAIRGRAFIFLDEALFAGDRKAADGIKSLSTATLIGIEDKGVPIVQCPVAVNLWLASNHDACAHIEEHDARYWVLDVSPHRIGDGVYFADLMREIENGGREAFAHHLLNLDVTDFIPWRDVPKDNVAKQEMIRRSINPYDARKWIEDCAISERIIGMKHPDGGGWQEWVEGESHSFAALADAYTEWQRTVKSPVAPQPTPRGSLGEILGMAGFEDASNYRARRRKLPRCENALQSLRNKQKDRTC